MRGLVATFTLTEREFLAIWRRLQLRRWRAWLCPALGVLIVLLGTGGSSETAVWVGGLFTAWSVWCVLSYAPRQVWRRLPALHESQTITLSDDGVKEELLHMTASFDWEHWTDVISLDSAWVLCSPGGYTFIPSRALPGPHDQALLRELAGTRVRDSKLLRF
jgi:hypothetical protein